jgi:hypothetical protein
MGNLDFARKYSVKNQNKKATAGSYGVPRIVSRGTRHCGPGWLVTSGDCRRSYARVKKK